jgi:hypothetical protein
MSAVRAALVTRIALIFAAGGGYSGVAGAIEIGDDPPPATPLILERIGF